MLLWLWCNLCGCIPYSTVLRNYFTLIIYGCQSFLRQLPWTFFYITYSTPDLAIWTLCITTMIFLESYEDDSVKCYYGFIVLKWYKSNLSLFISNTWFQKPISITESFVLRIIYEKNWKYFHKKVNTIYNIIRLTGPLIC